MHTEAVPYSTAILSEYSIYAYTHLSSGSFWSYVKFYLCWFVDLCHDFIHFFCTFLCANDRVCHTKMFNISYGFFVVDQIQLGASSIDKMMVMTVSWINDAILYMQWLLTDPSMVRSVSDLVCWAFLHRLKQIHVSCDNIDNNDLLINGWWERLFHMIHRECETNWSSMRWVCWKSMMGLIRYANSTFKWTSVVQKKKR